MPTPATFEACLALDREADLAQRFARLYRTQLAHLIEALNHTATGPPGAVDPLRHCIEAVDMVLASHEQFARSLKQLATAGPARSAAPSRRAA